MTKEILNIEQIKVLFPNEWVLLGNPEFQNTKVLTGIIIGHSKIKHELVDYAKTWSNNFETATTIYTGEFPKNRRFWL